MKDEFPEPTDAARVRAEAAEEKIRERAIALASQRIAYAAKEIQERTEQFVRSLQPPSTKG